MSKNTVREGKSFHHNFKSTGSCFCLGYFDGNVITVIVRHLKTLLMFKMAIIYSSIHKTIREALPEV